MQIKKGAADLPRSWNLGQASMTPTYLETMEEEKTHGVAPLQGPRDTLSVIVSVDARVVVASVSVDSAVITAIATTAETTDRLTTMPCGSLLA